MEALEDQRHNFPKMLLQDRVDGILLLGKIDREQVLLVQKRGIPLLLVGHPIPDFELPAIVPDGRSGAHQATKHLLSLGHKRIALITGEPEFDPIVSERMDGYRFAHTEAGVHLDERLIFRADWGVPETAFEATKRALELSDTPTAFFCMSDSLAYRCYRAIKEKNLRIPEDISVVGFDELWAPDFAELPQPPLTTIRVPREEMGKLAVEYLVGLTKNPDQPVLRYSLPVSLITKNSTAPPRTG